MISRAVRALLVLPLFAVLLYLLWPALSVAPLVTLVVIAAMIAENGAYLLRRGSHIVVAVVNGAILEATLLGLGSLAAPSLFGWAPLGSAPLYGLWLGAPFLAIGILVLSDTSPGAQLISLALAVFDALLLAGTVNALSGSPSGYTANTMLSVYSQEVSLQVTSWYHLLVGQGSASFPLQTLLPLPLVLASALAFLSVVVALLEPAIPAAAPAPTPDPLLLPASGPRRPSASLAARPVAVTGSPSLSPPRRALVYATAATLLVLGVAYVEPAWVLLVLAGFTAALLVLAVVAQSTTAPPPVAGAAASAVPRRVLYVVPARSEPAAPPPPPG